MLRGLLFSCWRLYIKKAWDRTCCPSHSSRLWYCPSQLNEQTCRASRRIWYVNSQCLRIVSLLTRITHSHWHLLFASFLTEIEIFQISECQERASSKRFPKCLCRIPPALPTTGLCSGGRHGKFKNIFLFLQNNRLNFIELTPGDWDFLDDFALRWAGADFLMYFL